MFFEDVAHRLVGHLVVVGRCLLQAAEGLHDRGRALRRGRGDELLLPKLQRGFVEGQSHERREQRQRRRGMRAASMATTSPWSANTIKAGQQLTLAAPGKGHLAVIINAIDQE